jgi:ABC-type transport system substrate-binding protein
VDQVLSTLDDEARYEVAGQAWTAIDELLPVIPIGLEVQVSMMKPNIKYVKSVGGMATGPMNLIDLRVE